jgi:TPR repeat protein
VPQDYAEAVKWFRKAADQGDAKAQLNLGFAYNTGQGVPQSSAEAVKWYRLAADQGYAGAQFISRPLEGLNELACVLAALGTNRKHPVLRTNENMSHVDRH